MAFIGLNAADRTDVLKCLVSARVHLLFNAPVHGNIAARFCLELAPMHHAAKCDGSICVFDPDWVCLSSYDGLVTAFTRIVDDIMQHCTGKPVPDNQEFLDNLTAYRDAFNANTEWVYLSKG